jgi:hypothetical protein
LGGTDTGPNPTDRSKSGSKHHLMVDGANVPLACTVTAANQHDVMALLATVTACPLLGFGEPARLPSRLLGDQASDSEGHEALLGWLGIEPVFAQRGRKHGSGWGRSLTWWNKPARRCTRTDG